VGNGVTDTYTNRYKNRYRNRRRGLQSRRVSHGRSQDEFGGGGVWDGMGQDLVSDSSDSFVSSPSIPSPPPSRGDFH